MTAPMPRVPGPPHDPTSLLLAERPGWMVLTDDDVTVASGPLELVRSPGSRRSIIEPSGSFGGLRPPDNVAVADDGSVYLLDRPTAELRRFDRCACRFETLACFGGAALADPGGIAVAGHTLYVCDTGHARLSVFVLAWLALRGHWQPPMAWQPTAVAVDGGGRVHVVDPLNGMVHRFSPRGRYLGNTGGVGASTHIAVDRAGVVYVAGAVDAFRIDTSGAVTALVATADDLAPGFASMPFDVLANGSMHLGVMCVPPNDRTFDGHGEATAPAAPATGPLYERAGTAVFGPLDSRIDGCQWHRIVVHGEVPSGGAAAFVMATADIDLPADRVADLLDLATDTHVECTGAVSGTWDALVRAQPGRYLWLRCRLQGDGRRTPQLRQIEVEFPRVGLRRLLPAVYSAEPTSADFTDRFLALFDRMQRDQELILDGLPALFDPMATPALDWLAAWIGLAFDRQLPEPLRRRLLVEAISSGDIRATPYGLWRMLVAFLGLDALVEVCQCPGEPCSCRPPVPTCPPTEPHRWRWQPPPLILEHFRLRRWLELGAGHIGDQAMLWGKGIVNRSQLNEGAQVGVTRLNATQDPYRDPFHVYAHRFSVFVPAQAGRTPERQRSLRRLVAAESPAHTLASIEFVQPRMRIGIQSMIGLDAVVGRVPAGVTLGETPLGPASVLTGDDSALIDTARIGPAAALS